MTMESALWIANSATGVAASGGTQFTHMNPYLQIICIYHPCQFMIVYASISCSLIMFNTYHIPHVFPQIFSCQLVL